MTSEERFERIERKHEELAALVMQIAEKVNRIAEGHVELEAAQLNQQRVHTRLEESLKSFIDETKDGIGNLTNLVERLVARDLES